jgi:hypothetical protein
MKRYDVITGREGKDGKTYWKNIGSMFPNDKGGFSIVLDALPVTGRCVAVEPRPRDGATDGGGNASIAATGDNGGMPF